MAERIVQLHTSEYEELVNTPELATYCGKQFIELWADFNLRVSNK